MTVPRLLGGGGSSHHGWQVEGCNSLPFAIDGTHRFNELQRRLTGVPPRLLIKQLRDLKKDGLVVRTVYAVVPPKVEYALSDEGRSLEPFHLGLCAWGDSWLASRNMKTAAQMKLEEQAELADAQPH